MYYLRAVRVSKSKVVSEYLCCRQGPLVFISNDIDHSIHCLIKIVWRNTTCLQIHFKHLLNCIWDHRCILHVFMMRERCKIIHNPEATSNLTFLIWPCQTSQMLKFHLSWRPDTRAIHSTRFFRKNHNRVSNSEVEI